MQVGVQVQSQALAQVRSRVVAQAAHAHRAADAVTVRRAAVAAMVAVIVHHLQ